ncbi:MAG: hypothetical protein QOI73_2198 [Solirubrobacteraceae bacterium]|nr:hypothetical protein [Solirubrobacteraceae bacterium]
MRHRPLYAALTAFAEEAAWQLAEQTADGAEVPFELVESRGRRRDTPLYCYRPLTEVFIRSHVGVFARLGSYPAAARALSGLDGVGEYLRDQGEGRVPADPRERADAALVVFVSRIFHEASEFVITAERLERAYAEIETSLFAGCSEAMVVVPVLGLQIASREIALGEGLSLVDGERFEDAPPDAVWQRDGDGVPAVLACLSLNSRADGPAPMTEARQRFRRLLSALRLFDPVRVALGPVAWERSGAGPWAMGDLGVGGRPNGVLEIDEASEDELRAFVSLVTRRTPRSGELAWALRRYELGCERLSLFEALTDHLLALRALLEPEGSASGRLAGRVAALCATEDRRVAVTERMAHAVSLERAVIAGIAPADGAIQVLMAEVTSHLRALLRDVLCGHLDSDLRAVADRMLAEAGAAQG